MFLRIFTTYVPILQLEIIKKLWTVKNVLFFFQHSRSKVPKAKYLKKTKNSIIIVSVKKLSSV